MKCKATGAAAGSSGHEAAGTNELLSAGGGGASQALDYEAHPVHSLIIVVENEEPLFSCEGGEPQRPRLAVASTTVSVQVTDTNHPPAFHPSSFVISEVKSPGPGTQLGSFKAIDPDSSGSQVR